MTNIGAKLSNIEPLVKINFACKFYMSKFSFKPKILPQLYLSYLHTGCFLYRNT